MIERVLDKIDRRVRVVAAGLLFTLGAAACGNDGYGSSVSDCKEGDNTGVQAEMDANNENDPSLILDFAQDANGSGVNTYEDETASGGLNRLSGDTVNGLGEVVCSAAEDSENPSSDPVFTPSGLEIRQDYMQEYGLPEASPEVPS